MKYLEGQTEVDISGTNLPKVRPEKGHAERFWYVQDEFIRNSKRMLNEGKMFDCIKAMRVGGRLVCNGPPISIDKLASFVWTLRLFYMPTESMSIDSVCLYMEQNIRDTRVVRFYKHMRHSWHEVLQRQSNLGLDGYSGPVITTKALIDIVLYSGNFHSQERYKRRYEELLKYVDETLIFMHTYNALHSGYQMNQISRSLSRLSEEDMTILLPNHLRHEWDENCPYRVF